MPVYLLFFCGYNELCGSICGFSESFTLYSRGLCLPQLRCTFSLQSFLMNQARPLLESPSKYISKVACSAITYWRISIFLEAFANAACCCKANHKSDNLGER